MTLNSRSAKLSSPNVKVQDVPNAPIIGNPSVSSQRDNSVDISVTPNARGGVAAQYRAISNPGNIEAVSYSSTITVPGLTGGTPYTFQVRGESAAGATSDYSEASQSITPTFGSMVAIASTPLTNAVVFSFGNIPQNYQDLMIVISGPLNSNSNLVIDDINNNVQTYNTGSTALVGNGSSPFSERVSNYGNGLLIHSPNSQFVPNANSVIIHLNDYASSTSFKTVLSRKASDNNGSGTTAMMAGVIPITSPITYFKFSTQNPAWYFTGGTASLYGIRASI